VSQSFHVTFLLLEEALNQAETGPFLAVPVPPACEPAQLTIAHRIAIDFRLNSGRSVLVYRMVSNVEQRRLQIQQRSGSGVFET
jgi:hypothetical protein